MAQSRVSQLMLDLADHKDAFGFKLAANCQFRDAALVWSSAQQDRINAARAVELLRGLCP